MNNNNNNNNNNNKIEMNKRDLEIPKKNLLEFQQKKKKKFFDSADWVINGEQYENYPIKQFNENNKNYYPLIIKEFQCEEDNQQKVNYAQRQLKEKKERKYFDSADWALGYEISTQPYLFQQDPKKILVKKNLEKSRKYFDSADWASSLQHVNTTSNYIPQLYPKLPVLKI